MSECLTKDYFKVAVKIILFILLLAFLYFIRDIVILLFLSFILAAIFIPVVDYLEKQKISRILSSVFIYLFSLLLLLGLVYLVIPPLSHQSGLIISKISSLYHSAIAFLDSGQTIVPSDLFQIPGWQGGFKTLGQGIFSFLGNVVSTVFALILMVVLSFYIVIEKKNLLKFFISLFPDKYHNFVDRLFYLAQEDLRAWGAGKLILSFFVGIFCYVGLLIIGVPFAFSLAIFAGVTEFIPWVGPFIGAIPAVLLALLDSPVKALVVALIYILVQQVENNLVVPQLMKKAVGLNPIVVITVLLIGVKMGGILGAIIAVPATAVISIFVREYLKLRQQLKIEGEK